ncbi:DUF3331 domain-containing protein [Paraburkholderia sp. BL21I4N1]|uniref:DUF3331 domain-containing protein n=1 Tax=Paraburkholderia sp. BL21I4N1 TaxID=1938801 RepID=UPI000CFE290B|nr:DUF3331 domain-containing protein [Paraburkholderia sp. BL21I4N1]PQV44839.1 uncharacterized protein DUF3331 [Paraburkholderia sp. BL21I4N1]
MKTETVSASVQVSVRQHTLQANVARQAACQTSYEPSGATFDDAGVSVWDHVIRALRRVDRSDGDGEGAAEAFLPRPASRRAAYALSPHVQVEVVERLSETSIAVLWQDATRCRYADQVWISCRARLKGRCALSGAVIRRDDMIYKPRVRASIPANAAAMILASVVEQLPAMKMALTGSAPDRKHEAAHHAVRA